MMNLVQEAQPPRYERRLRRVPISNAFLTNILRGGYPQDVRDIVTNLPDDAEVVHIVADMMRDCIVAFVRSNDFDVVEDGSEVPEFNPTYTVTERT